MPALLQVSFSLRAAQTGFADGVTLQTGGSQIVLPAAWEELHQPASFFVQQRARNSETGVAVSAGTIRLDLDFEQFEVITPAVGIPGEQSPIDKIMMLARLPVPEVETALRSDVGQQMLEQLKRGIST